MKLHGTSRINAEGILEIGGCSAVELIKTYGSPLWVLDEELIRETCRRFKRNFTSQQNTEVLYAGKAFLTIAMCKIIEQEGLGLDVVSGGELFTAIKADFPMERVFFHGNNKSQAELNLALKNKIGKIVVDNFDEMKLLNKLAGTLGIIQPILLRITPGVNAKTHKYIKTGQIDSKFGFTLPDGTALNAINDALQLPNIQLDGIHCHIGSQIFDLNSYKYLVGKMLEFLVLVKNQTGKVLTELNLGGGFGIYYTKNDCPPSIEEYSKTILDTVKQKCKEFLMSPPKIYVEPGRSIVGSAGTTLYSAGTLKHIKGVRKYLAVDGGMYENIRPALYDASYEVYVANKMKEPNWETVTITGKCCESGDILAKEVHLPKVIPGDIIAMTSTGAYGYSMSGNYNRLPKQAVVLVYNSEAEVIVKRETYEDIIRNDLLPRRLDQGTQ